MTKPPPQATCADPNCLEALPVPEPDKGFGWSRVELQDGTIQRYCPLHKTGVRVKLDQQTEAITAYGWKVKKAKRLAEAARAKGDEQTAGYYDTKARANQRHLDLAIKDRGEFQEWLVTRQKNDYSQLPDISKLDPFNPGTDLFSQLYRR